MGLLAAVGIVKGQPFKPGQRMRKILEDAVAVGNATARTISFAPRPEEGFAYYPGSAWINMLFTGGYQFLDPPPQITADGVVPAPSDGARKLNSRIAFFYPATGTTPAALAVHAMAAFLLRYWFGFYGHAYGGFGIGLALIAFTGIIASFWVWIATVMGVYWEDKAGPTAVAAMEKLSADTSAP